MRSRTASGEPTVGLIFFEPGGAEATTDADGAFVLRDLIARHAKETGSRLAARILNDWAEERGSFWHVVPKDYAKLLPRPMNDQLMAAE